MLTTLSEPSREKNSNICDESTAIIPLLSPTIGSKLWKTTAALFLSGESTRSVMIREKNTMIMYAAMKPSRSGRYLTR
jgi:hypothetical protein